MKRSPILALVLCLAVVAGGSPAASQDVDGVSEGPFIDRVNVEVVELQVNVTDRKGNSIDDLTAEDFEIFEDGRPVSLSHFSPPDLSSEEESIVKPRLELPSAEAARNVVAEEPSTPHFLVIYVDNLNIKPFDRNRVFRGVRTFLGREVDPDRKTMLVSYTRSIKERVPFTSDPSLITRGLLELEGESALGTQRESERNDVLRTIEEAQSISFARSQARTYASSYHNDTMFTIDALREMVDSLAGLPGRKSMLYVSSGVPEIPGEELFYAIQDKYKESSMLMEAREFDAGRRFRELAHQANTNGVTFYAIDAAGLRTPSAASASRNVVSSAALLDAHTIHNLQAPLLRLARETGGRAIINTNDPTDQLMEIRQDLRRFYGLAYQPSHAGDGRYHRIEVKVKRKGTRVRHRQGYRARSLEQRMGDATRAALLFQEYANPMRLKVAIGNIARAEDQFAVPITVQIPIDELVFLERGANQEASLEVFFSALDSEGGLSPVQKVRIPIEIETVMMDQARGKRFGYEFSLLMRGGDHRIAIGLHDNIGGDDSFVVGQFDVVAR